MMQKLWIIYRPGGEHYILTKEPLGGIAAWAKGQDVSVAEYTLSRVVYQPPVKAAKQKDAKGK